MIEVKNLAFFHKNEFHSRYSEGSFIRLKNNDIVFFCTRYNGERANDNAPADIIKYTSKDNGDTWSEPEIVFRGKDFGAVNLSSVSVLRLNNGDIGILFMHLVVPNFVHHFLFARSSDEGKTWTKPFNTIPVTYEGKCIVNNNRLLKLSSGRLIYPLALHAGSLPGRYERDHYNGSKYTTCTVIFSDDDGKTWSAGSDYICPPFTKTTVGIQEGCLWEIRPGVIKCLWRTDKMYQYEAVSYDNGDHWSVPTPSCFTAPCSPITLIRSQYNGKIYAVWNPVPNYNRSGPDQLRTPLVVAETDGCINSFTNLEIIEDDPGCCYAYISGMFTAENELLLAYSSGKKIIHGGRGMWSRMTISKVYFK